MAISHEWTRMIYIIRFHVFHNFLQLSQRVLKHIVTPRFLSDIQVSDMSTYGINVAE